MKPEYKNNWRYCKCKNLNMKSPIGSLPREIAKGTYNVSPPSGHQAPCNGVVLLSMNSSRVFVLILVRWPPTASMAARSSAYRSRVQQSEVTRAGEGRKSIFFAGRFTKCRCTVASGIVSDGCSNFKRHPTQHICRAIPISFCLGSLRSIQSIVLVKLDFSSN